VTDYIISGIGNPGAQHAGQRHNAGFWLIDALAKRHGISLKSSTLAHTGKGEIGGAEVLLMKPRTYVNSSGKAIGPAMRREGVPAERVIVAYDDLDLPEGRLRLRPKGGAGGHNGLKSIIDAAGSGDFGRVRLGIGRPYHQGVPTWDPELVVRYVLDNPQKASKEALDESIQRACDAIELIIREGWDKAMDVYNRA
jgi:peptidyl-tRNA hydrolase, PTH1 family